MLLLEVDGAFLALGAATAPLTLPIGIRQPVARLLGAAALALLLRTQAHRPPPLRRRAAGAPPHTPLGRQPVARPLEAAALAHLPLRSPCSCPHRLLGLHSCCFLSLLGFRSLRHNPGGSAGVGTAGPATRVNNPPFAQPLGPPGVLPIATQWCQSNTIRKAAARWAPPGLLSPTFRRNFLGSLGHKVDCRACLYTRRKAHLMKTAGVETKPVRNKRRNAETQERTGHKLEVSLERFVGFVAGCALAESFVHRRIELQTGGVSTLRLERAATSSSNAR